MTHSQFTELSNSSAQLSMADGGVARAEYFHTAPPGRSPFPWADPDHIQYKAAVVCSNREDATKIF